MAPNEDDPIVPDTSQWQWAAMEPELNQREKDLRNLFVNEYLVDYNPIEAAQRCGFQYAFAKDYAIKFLNESYVQRRIKELEHTKPPAPKQLEEYNKERVIAGLMREAHNVMTTGSCRVAALSTLAKIYGMDKTPELKPDHTHKGGVLMVPAIANLDDWEQVAQASQAKLVADVRH